MSESNIAASRSNDASATRVIHARSTATDARKRGIGAWPFVAVTLVAGSFGPLLYLVIREVRAPRGS